MRAEGRKVSSLHLTFLQPMPGGIKEILQRFKQVITIEGNWSDRPEDPLIDDSNRRYSALAMLLRARYLVDVDCWSEIRGRPIKPSSICAVLRNRLVPEGTRS
jgi:2-oxoglutarate/2-oxoacid ferredoxin oxidoreductase subunit alpha